jgi:uncharacterized protein involved in outer membrane biogenesis/outer membrane protein OmpA-like peptidoglycan-associated protein
MRRIKKWLIGLVLFFVVFTLFGFFGVPPILKSVLVKKMSEALKREVTIEKIKVNPFTLSVTTAGIRIQEHGGSEPFVSCDELFIKIEILSAVKRALILKELRIQNPYLKLARQNEQTYNFSDLIPKKEEKPEEKSTPFLFSLNNIQIENGKIEFWDGVTQKKHTVSDLKIGIPFLSNIPYEVETFVQPSLTAKINGAPYAFYGQTKPFADSLETSLDIEISDLNLPYYLAYVPIQMKMKILSAFLDVKGKVTFIQQKGKPPSANISGDLALKKIAVDDLQQNPLLRLPRLEASVVSARPLLKSFHLKKIAIHSPEAEIRRGRKGDLEIQSLIPKQGDEKTPVKSEPETSPLSLEIDEIEMIGGKLTFIDLSRKMPFQTVLSPIEVKIENFSNGKDKKSNYTLVIKTEAKEEIQLAGSFSVVPLQGSGNVEIKEVPLKKYAPYYQEFISFDLADGRLDFSTVYQYAQGEKETAVSLKEMAASLKSLRLKKEGEKEDFLSIPTLMVRDTELDLNGKSLRIGSLTTEKGTLSVQRLKNGEFDLQRPGILIPVPPPKDKTPPSAKEAQDDRKWAITLGQVRLDQYTLKMTDATPSQPTSMIAEKMALRAENISTKKNQLGKFALSLLLDQKTSVSTQAAVGIEPLRADGSLEVRQLSLRQYAPYYQDKILFDIESGDVDLAARYQYAKGEKETVTRATGISASVKALQLKKRGEAEDFLTIPAVLIRNTGIDLTKNEITVGEFATEKGSVLVRRLNNGEINLLSLLPPAAKKTEKPEEKQEPQAGKPWVVKVGRLAVDQYRLKWDDQVPSEAVQILLDEIGVKGENLSTAKDEKGRLSLTLRLDQKGKVTVGGGFGIAPLSADLEVGVQEAEIHPVQPYFTDRVKIIVTDGKFSTSGNLALKTEEGKGLQVSYKGNSNLNQFASIDKPNAEDFLKWESLSFTGIDAGYNPFYLRLDGAALSNFYARLMINPDGTLNLQNILTEQKKEGAKPAEPSGQKPAPDKEPGGKESAPPADISIQRVTLQGGHIDFSDNYIQPNYSANFMEIGGRVSGLSSEEGKSADVELRGMLGQIAPLEITGKLNPLGKDLFVDLSVKFKDIDLSPMTPYAGKYMGYKIQKGKLFMDLKYQIVKRKLDSQNKIFFDQFNLGDKVESPQATKLPVRLAISLLKDRKGEIHLDIPVTGSLDDPKFSVFSIILQVLGNLIAKAATSPFALIGAIMGGGQQLDNLEFDYGSAAVAGDSEAKINTLLKALKDRPGVSLEIEGHVDLEKDREGLKQLFFQRKLKAQKLKEIIKKGQPSVPVDEVKIESPEYPKYLKLAYKEERFPKPKNFIGFVKDLPNPEMEKLMLTHIVINEGDLRTLAAQRTARVRDTLVKAGVESDRLFIVEPKSLAPEKKDKIKDSRVDFRLK